MEIRSVTLFCEPDFGGPQAARFFEAAQGSFNRPVQTHRAALTPFPLWWDRTRGPAGQAAALAARWRELGADYLCLGPVQLEHDIDWVRQLPAVLGVEDMVFASAEIAAADGRIDTGRCRAVARVIGEASTLRDDGFGNLFFAALAVCPPGSPFFPAAYHKGGPPRFALAVEAADLALAAIETAGDLAEARRNLVTAIEQEGAALIAGAAELEAAHGIAFAGLDFSLAPFPEPEKSLVAAMEALGVPWVGGTGSLFAAAFITEAIGRANIPHCGFSGLFLPVLEDSVLAARAAARQVTVIDLLAYAAVCGTGLDTVPLPGDCSEESLAALLLDVAALAARLQKPLTARLMPLPGKKAGDAVAFDFPYFAEGRVMALAGPGVSGLMAGTEEVRLRGLRKAG